jgi:hypothetical protein
MRGRGFAVEPRRGSATWFSVSCDASLLLSFDNAVVPVSPRFMVKQLPFKLQYFSLEYVIVTHLVCRDDYSYGTGRPAKDCGKTQNGRDSKSLTLPRGVVLVFDSTYEANEIHARL